MESSHGTHKASPLQQAVMPVNLRPAAPDFQPTGTELQRFIQPPPTPTPSGPMSSDAKSSFHENLAHLAELVAGTHSRQLAEQIKTEQLVRNNGEEFHEHRAIVTQDLRSLKAEIDELKAQLASSTQKVEEANGEDKGSTSLVVRRPGGKLVPPKAWLRQHGERVVAEAYLVEADQAEGVARLLREQAEIIDPGCLHERGIHLNLLDHRPPRSETVHTSEVETPTRAPARRNQETPHASRIEAPDDADLSQTNGSTAVQASSSIHSFADSSNTTWTPLAVRHMPATPITAPDSTETFTWVFLTFTLGGSQWSPGFYFSNKNCLLPSMSYWLLEGAYEPHLPSAPGQHGAKLTAFFNETLSAPGQAPHETNYLNSPVFIRAEKESEYKYFGNYSQLRYSDKLDYDHVAEYVPELVKRYWAELLASNDRPAWVTKALMHHFWPKPTYGGPIPTDSAINSPATAGTAASSNHVGLERKVQRALEAYANALKSWEKEARMKVSLLTAENLSQAFGNADADIEPGLRLWWEYLQFVGWDEGFYGKIVEIKKKGQVVQPATEAVANDVGVLTKPGQAFEAVDANGEAIANGAAKPLKAALGKTVEGKQGIETIRPSAARGRSTTPKVKNHTNSVKPWEKPAEVARPTPLQNGNLKLAKQLQEQQKSSGGKNSSKCGFGLDDGDQQEKAKGSWVPPHKRGGNTQAKEEISTVG